VVSEAHAKLSSCRVERIQIGNPCYCQELDERAVLLIQRCVLMDVGMLKVEIAGEPRQWAERLDKGR
jgi:hypothetical protein